MKSTNKKVDLFIKGEKKWQDQVTLLRKIILECDVEEDFKWRFPCYTNNDKNVVMIQSFKNFCAVLFFNGASLKDPKKVLKAPGENSHIGRRIEFTTVAEVSKMKSAIKGFINQTIKDVNSDKKSVKKAPKALVIPAELKAAFGKNKRLKEAFENLTPGRQRLYVIHISSAKQEATRLSRVEKCAPKILKGLGLND